MLHTLRQSVLRTDLITLQSLLQPGDALLLLQDGIYCGQAEGPLQAVLVRNQVAVFALRADVVARGFAPWLDKRIRLIEYGDFVTLTVQHLQQMSW